VGLHVPLRGQLFTFHMQMIVPHREQIYRALRLVTGMALLLKRWRHQIFSKKSIFTQGPRALKKRRMFSFNTYSTGKLLIFGSFLPLPGAWLFSNCRGGKHLISNSPHGARAHESTVSNYTFL
jgi:hypothetical protein